jgi:hypothetical protein
MEIASSGRRVNLSLYDALPGIKATYKDASASGEEDLFNVKRDSSTIRTLNLLGSDLNRVDSASDLYLRAANGSTLHLGSPANVNMIQLLTGSVLAQINAFTQIVGNSDNVQLAVKGNATQTSDLQNWTTSGGTVLAAVKSDGKVQVGASGAPYILSGSGAPSADAPIASLYLRTDGGVGTSLYVKEVAGAGAGNWKAK